jgi:anti-sigma B factor antagonist
MEYHALCPEQSVAPSRCGLPWAFSRLERIKLGAEEMPISTEELDGGITRVILDGRLDIEGAAAVDMRMNVIAGTKKAVIVDMQNVSFLGSMGLRALVAPARAIKGRGGKIVIFGPNEMVEKVLKTSGVDTMIPIHHELQNAIAALQ